MQDLKQELTNVYARHDAGWVWVVAGDITATHDGGVSYVFSAVMRTEDHIEYGNPMDINAVY